MRLLRLMEIDKNKDQAMFWRFICLSFLLEERRVVKKNGLFILMTPLSYGMSKPFQAVAQHKGSVYSLCKRLSSNPPTMCWGQLQFCEQGLPYQPIVPLPVFIIAPNMSIYKEILATVFTFECRGQKIFDGTKAGVLGVVKSVLAVV